MPSGEGPFAAVALLSDSGPQERDCDLQGYHLFGILADYLTRHGIAVLRFDDRGVGRSGGDYARATTADGYFRTGDVAVLNPDGQVRIVDRMKDMILVSGFNVYPNEIEDVLASHPGVLECAVVGAPCGDSGEMVVAHVVLRDPSVEPDALRAHARASLTGYKVPRRVVFHDTLPKTNVGKVLRRALRDDPPPP